MIRRAVILVGVPVLIAALVAFPLGLWKGEYQWLCAGVAAALVVPPGLVTLILAERLTRVSVLGPFLALAIGTAVRVVVGFGGAVAVFFAWRPVFSADPFSYLAWVLGSYLTTLAIETALLSGQRPGCEGLELRKAIPARCGDGKEDRPLLARRR